MPKARFIRSKSLILTLFKSHRYQLRLANDLIKRGRFEEADDLISTSIFLRPQNRNMRIAHAVSAHNSGRYATALDRWDHVRLNWPDYAMAWSGCAANLRELGALERAKSIIEETLLRFPSDQIALSEGVRIFDRLGDRKKSLALSAKIEGHNPSHLAAVIKRPKQKTPLMIFMYWTGAEISTAPAADAWDSIYSNFKVFDDTDVIPLLPTDFVSTYNKIRLPSAKSDLARLLLLREHGGLYIDAHIGPTSPENLRDTLDGLSTFNLILFGKGWVMEKDHDFDLMNGVLAARKGAPELDLLIDAIIGNIVDQRKKETDNPDYIKYSLFELTGTGVLINSFFDLVAPRPAIKKDLTKKVHVHFMKDNKLSGFEIAAYYNYRKPGGHWSERQDNERFFLD